MSKKFSFGKSKANVDQDLDKIIKFVINKTKNEKPNATRSNNIG